MFENNLKPTIIKTLYDIEEEIKSFGLSDKDLILLLQSRIRIKNKHGWTAKMTQKQIKTVLEGLKDFEKEFMFNRMKREEAMD